MELIKTTLLSEGKTKRMWATNDPKFAIAEFYDDAMYYHGKRKVYFKDKGKLTNEINFVLMKVLEDNNIPTAFVEKYSDNSMVVKLAEMLPLEVVVRNYSAGTMIERLGLGYHEKLKYPVLELCYKNDSLGDPVINDYHAYAMELCTQEEMSVITYNAMRINKVLCDLMREAGIIVADFKVEFGRVNGRLLVADEISPNVARFWDKNTLRRMDNEGKSPEEEYKKILELIKQVAHC